MELAEALRRTCDLLAHSEDSDWTPWSAAEIREELALALASVEAGRAPDKSRLRLLFVAAGPVQETSMANGWSDEMRRLAEVVDRYTEEA
jgi:hypothetical protein